MYLFYGWRCWVFAAGHRPSPVAGSRGYSLAAALGPLTALEAGSRHASFSSCGWWAQEHRPSTWGTRAQLLRGTWDLPEPGTEAMSLPLSHQGSSTLDSLECLLLYFPRESVYLKEGLPSRCRSALGPWSRVSPPDVKCVSLSLLQAEFKTHISEMTLFPS